MFTLSTQDNSKLLPLLKNSFKRTITWNKYLIKPELLAQNMNLNHLVESSFQGINRLSVLAFENDDHKIIKIYENIRKIAMGQGNDYNWLFIRLYLFQKVL